VDQDDSQAASWYRKAAEQGDDQSQYRLGGFYYEGIGLEQDYAQAAYWFLKAARQGHIDATRALEHMRRMGYY